MSGSGNIVGEVGATINNLNGMAGPATFNVESDMEITFPTGIGDGLFNNLGLFEKTAGGTAPGDMTEIGDAQGFTFNNDGDCQVQQGTLGLGDDANASVSQGGEFDIFPGATLEYLRGQEFIVPSQTGGLPWINGPSGTLLMTGGNVQHYGIFDVNTVDMESGLLMLDQNMSTAGTGQSVTDANNFCPAGNVNNLNISGGTIGGDGGGVFDVGTTTIYNNPGNPPTTPAGPFATSVRTAGLPTGSRHLPTAGTDRERHVQLDQRNHRG